MKSVRVALLFGLSIAGWCVSGCSSGPGGAPSLGDVAATGSGEAKAPAESQSHAAVAPLKEPAKVQMVDVAGFKAELAKHKGKVVVVDFWATWCGPCVERFPHMVGLSHQFPTEDVAFISVSFDETSETGKKQAVQFLTKSGADVMHNLQINFDYIEAFEAFDIRDGIPHYQLYDRAGALRHRFSAIANPKEDVLAADDLDVKLRELLVKE